MVEMNCQKDDIWLPPPVTTCWNVDQGGSPLIWWLPGSDYVTSHQSPASSANMPIVWPSLIAGREFDRFPQSCLRRGCSGVGGEVSIRPRIFQLLNNDPWIMTADWTNIDPAPLHQEEFHKTKHRPSTRLQNLDNLEANTGDILLYMSLFINIC